MPNAGSQIHPMVERFARLTDQKASGEVEQNDSDENGNINDEKENKNKFEINNFDESLAKVNEEEVCNFFII